MSFQSLKFKNIKNSRVFSQITTALKPYHYKTANKLYLNYLNDINFLRIKTKKWHSYTSILKYQSLSPLPQKQPTYLIFLLEI